MIYIVTQKFVVLHLNLQCRYHDLFDWQSTACTVSHYSVIIQENGLKLFIRNVTQVTQSTFFVAHFVILHKATILKIITLKY